MKMLPRLGLAPSALHNAGNDAYHEIEAMLYYLVMTQDQITEYKDEKKKTITWY